MPFEPRLFQPHEGQPSNGQLHEGHADDAALAAALGLPTPSELLAAKATADARGDDGFLAPELEALAEQLSEDSGHLAQCYPAVNPRVNELVARAAQLAEAEALRAEAARSRQVSVSVWLARCGLAASLLLALGVWWQNAHQMDEPLVAQPLAHSLAHSVAQLGAAGVVAPEHPVSQPSLASTAVEPELAVHESTDPMPMLDPQVFLELDAASQAAVADLVQEGELNQSSLSL